MGEPGRVVVDSEAGSIELRKGSVVELREDMSCEYSQSLWVDLGDRVRGDDMNCSYCGCLLPDEYHPNCKQCGGPRKAAREEAEQDTATWMAGTIALMCGRPVGKWEISSNKVDYGEGIHDDPEYAWPAPAIDNSLEAAWKRIKGAVR